MAWDKREIGVPQNLVLIDCVSGHDRNADAGTDTDNVAIDDVGAAQQIDETLRQRCRRLRLRLAGLDDAEPIATEAGRDVAGLESGAESLRDHAQKRVANLATERLIDSLEAIEVDCQHGCKVGLAMELCRNRFADVH